MASEEDRFDVFISHASEDKDDLVRPLARKLRQYGVHVWYDEFTLRPGQGLRESLDSGLSRSDRGLVVVSKAFIGKAWTKKEMDAFFAREAVEDERIIIPIWWRISAREVAEFSPILADVLAITVEDGYDIRDIAVEVLDALEHPMASRMRGLRILEELRESSSPGSTRVSELRPGPHRHAGIPGDQVARSMLVTAKLSEADSRIGDLRLFIDNLRRDVTPESELRQWEIIAVAYHYCVEELGKAGLEPTADLRRSCLTVMVQSSLGMTIETIGEDPDYNAVVEHAQRVWQWATKLLGGRDQSAEGR